MIDAIISLEGQVEQGQHRLVVGHVRGLEDRPRCQTVFCGAELLAAFSQQALARDVVEVPKADIGTALQGLLHYARADAIGTTCASKSARLHEMKRQGTHTGDENHLVLERVRRDVRNVLRHDGEGVRGVDAQSIGVPG